MSKFLLPYFTLSYRSCPMNSCAETKDVYRVCAGVVAANTWSTRHETWEQAQQHRHIITSSHGSSHRTKRAERWWSKDQNMGPFGSYLGRKKKKTNEIYRHQLSTAWTLFPRPSHFFSHRDRRLELTGINARALASLKPHSSRWDQCTCRCCLAGKAGWA